MQLARPVMIFKSESRIGFTKLDFCSLHRFEVNSKMPQSDLKIAGVQIRCLPFIRAVIQAYDSTTFSVLYFGLI